MEDWTQHLRRSLDKLPIVSPLCRLEVYGERAIPVVHAESSKAIVFAAAVLGTGRICVTTNEAWIDGSLKDASLFYCITREWVTRGKYNNDDDIMVITKEMNEIPSDVQIVMYTGGPLKRKMEDVVYRFVERGGALLYGSARGKPFLATGEPHSSIPLSSVLLHAGISLTKVGIPGTKNEFPIGTLDWQYHVRNLIGKCHGDIEYLKRSGGDLLKSLVNIPAEILRGELNDSLQNLAIKYEYLLSECFSDGSKTVKQPHLLMVLKLVNIMANNNIYYTKSPGATHFPGDFSDLPDLMCGEITIAGKYSEAYPTGFYLPAGYNLLVTVNSDRNDFRKWSIQIGAHTDDLAHKDKLKRYPIVFIKSKLHNKKMEIFSAHGGLIYLYSPGKDSTITVRFENVLQAPLYDKMRSNALSHWQETRHHPGLWADIAGENVVFTVPSDDVRHIEDLGEFVDFWDEVVAGQHDLRGTDQRTVRRQWIVADQQPVKGAMHSGYPIVTKLSLSDRTKEANIFNMPKSKTEGRWGLFHEIGHNMQRKSWTFDGTIEVTNNIFSLFSMDTITQAKLWIHSWPERQMDKAKEYLNSRPMEFNPKHSILLFTQLAHHFGWDSYRQYFRTYESTPVASQPCENADKIDQWIIRFSNITRHNLIPLFDFWGFPISDNAKMELETEGMEPTLPEDEMTQLAPRRFQRMIKKYGGRSSVITEFRSESCCLPTTQDDRLVAAGPSMLGNTAEESVDFEEESDVASCCDIEEDSDE